MKFRDHKICNKKFLLEKHDTVFLKRPTSFKTNLNLTLRSWKTIYYFKSTFTSNWHPIQFLLTSKLRPNCTLCYFILKYLNFIRKYFTFFKIHFNTFKSCFFGNFFECRMLIRCLNLKLTESENSTIHHTTSGKNFIFAEKENRKKIN